MNYEKEFYHLKEHLEDDGLVIIFVRKNTFEDFAAMNSITAKRFGVLWPYNADIAIEQGHSWRTQFKNLVHEATEMYKEMKQHLPYWPSHAAAEHEEKRNPKREERDVEAMYDHRKQK